jgi:acetyl-CoA carboxylase beta subunit
MISSRARRGPENFNVPLRVSSSTSSRDAVQETLTCLCAFLVQHQAEACEKESRLTEINARQRAESLFDRDKRRNVEIAEALKQEQARHEAVIENMHRLRALRMAQDAQKRPDEVTE